METTTPMYKIRGRHLSQHDLAEIREVVTDHWDAGRTAISKILCQRWQWRLPNGQLKDMACRSLLLTLEKKGELILSPRMKESYRFPRRVDRRTYAIDTTEMAGPVSAFGSLIIKLVRQSPDEGIWDYLIDRYHYLGSPWINVHHLASKVLALNIRQLEHDWFAFYPEPICLLETFVETGRFQGACYRAANWTKVGETTGRGKYDRYNQRTEPLKAVFLYPLTKKFREQLCG